MTKREIESGRVDIRLLRVGSPCLAPTYPALYKTSTEKHKKKTSEKYLKLSTDNLTQLCSKHQQRNMKKNIREIFEIVNRQSYPSEIYLKLSTDNLTQLCTKDQQRKMKKNIREIFKFVNRQSRYHVRS